MNPAAGVMSQSSSVFSIRARTSGRSGDATPASMRTLAARIRRSGWSPSTNGTAVSTTPPVAPATSPAAPRAVPLSDFTSPSSCPRTPVLLMPKLPASAFPFAGTRWAHRRNPN